MKYSTLIGIILVLSLFISCNKKNKEQTGKEKPPVAVDVIIAGDKNIISSLEVNGNVLSAEMVDFHPEISGRITYLNMPDGGIVQAGTILARINDAELQAQLEQQQAQLDLAIKTEKRLKELLKVNGINQADYDAALNQVTSILATIKVTHAQIDKTVIKAPFTGKLGLRQVSLGAYVTPPTLLGSLQQTDKVKIDFTVPETQAIILKPGKKIKIKLNGSKESSIAIITAIEPQINSVNRNIKARAIPIGGTFLPGAFVKVILDQTQNGIMVPTNAIIPDALSSQVVVVENGKASFRNVETGHRSASLVELTNGVKEGDSIIVSGMLFVRPNAVVKIKKVKTLKDLS